MFPLLAAGAIAGIGGGLIQNAATRHATDQGIDFAREQMRWQEMMSSTAHQREVTDLRAAGLNPVLSAGGGGASTGSTSSPNIGTQSGVGNALSSLPAQVASMMATKAAIGKTTADTNLVNAQIPGAQATSAIQIEALKKSRVHGGFWDSLRRNLSLDDVFSGKKNAFIGPSDRKTTLQQDIRMIRRRD